MQIGDSVVWTQVKHSGNQTELTKSEGVIQSIRGGKAAVRNSVTRRKFVVAISELTLKSADSPRLLLEYAFKRFGVGAAP